MEYKVNEIFELLGHRLKAIATPTPLSCDGCWLNREIGCMYRGLKCTANERQDGIDVIFKKEII